MKLLKFAASWCGPCQGLSMLINNIKEQINIPIEEIDIDKNSELAVQYGVRSVPTLIIVNENGEEIKRNVGSMVKDDLLKFIEE